MKIFKNCLCIFFLGLASISCNDDEETLKPSLAEKIVGTWNLVNRESNGEEIGVEVCELQTIYQFLENKDFEAELYFGDDPADCESTSVSGQYEFIDKNTIEINLSGVTVNPTADVSFAENGNVLRLTTDSGEGDVEIFVKQ